MFSHDPFQNYQTLGAYGAGVTPYGLPFQGTQPAIHPLAFAGPPYSNPTVGYGAYPLIGGIGGSQQLPWQQLQTPYPPAVGLQNPLLQHLLAHAAWQNPLLNPALAYHQMLAQQAWQQPQTQFNYPLAPQTLIGGAGIGQPGLGQHYGQIHPLAQMAMRQTTGLGLSPFAF